jgi:hypothetical protein
MPLSSSSFSSTLAAISLLWLGFGGFVLALTPVPAHTASLGWSPLFWLLVAPLCVLAGLRLRRLSFGRSRAFG